MMPEKKQLTYSDTGVNIDEGNRFVSKIKSMMKNKKQPGVLGGIGSFGGLFDLSEIDIKDPVLVTSIDGVGTKLEVAKKMKRFESVGHDIVCHSINDILVQGAKPLYFTDYIGCGRLDANVMEQVIQGLSEACEANQLALIGGETAEMPGIYQEDDYDLVGSITGVVSKSKIITGERIAAGDVLIALPSSGLHTNGYSLARKIVFEVKGLDPHDSVAELGTTIGDALLVPHRSYGPLLYPLMSKFDIKGMAHITGGGITENVPRILPDHLSVKIEITQEVPPIFKLLQEWGNVSQEEMYRVFNMGIGMIVTLSSDESSQFLAECQKTYPSAHVVGRVVDNSPVKVNYSF